jgi:8-oxo-(d)GTP phosphatase
MVLGRPLGEIGYRLPDGGRKEVSYWAARPAAASPGNTAGHLTENAKTSAENRRENAAEIDPPAEVAPEVDGVAWLPVLEARSLLTRGSDVEPLRLLEQYAAAGVLATAPMLVVRHGTSRPRDSWAHADADRPLVSAGRRQAAGLVEVLACWRPERLVSSPWRRCLDTVAPYAAATSLAVRTKSSLTEDGARRSPARTRRQVQRLLDRARPALLCTHRPVLAEVFDVVRSACAPDVAAAVPGKDPYLAPGEVLVAHLAPAGGPARVVAVERHQPRS